MNGVCSPASQTGGVTPGGASTGGVSAAVAAAAAATDRSSLAGSGSSLVGSGSRGSRSTEPPRRSRSQGTRKLHKCLSTASYTEDGHSPIQQTANQQRQLLVARQYCSFGSTVTVKCVSVSVIHSLNTLSCITEHPPPLPPPQNHHHRYQSQLAGGVRALPRPRPLSTNHRVDSLSLSVSLVAPRSNRSLCTLMLCFCIIYH